MIKPQEKEFIFIVMGLFIKVNGRKINNMESVKKFGLMAHLMKENLYKEKNKVKEYLNGVMEQYMKVNLKIII